MKKIRLLAAALSLALLAGCGTTAADPTPTPAAEQGDDMAYRVIGITKDTPMLTVDGAPVSAETVLFWMAQGVDSWLSGAGISLEDDWTQPYGASGMTIGEAVKADVLSTVQYFQVIKNKAGELGIAFTAGEEDAIAQEFAAAIESAGGEETFQSRLQQMCISREGFEDLNRISYLYEAMAAKLASDGKLDDSYTVEDFLAEKGIYAAKHILLSTRRLNEEGTGYEDFSDEEKAAVKAQIDGLRAQLAAAGDSEELFDELMNQYSEDGRDNNGDLYAPGGYTYVYPMESMTSYDQMVMVTEFEEGARALQVGEISQPVQTDYGYHIILRIEVDTSQAGEDMFNALLEKWLLTSQVETTPAYDDLDAKEFYQSLQQVREQLADQ